MSQVNPANERLKRRYFHYQREAQGLAEITVDHAARAIFDFERFTDFADFGRFRSDDAIAYRRHLMAGGGKRASQLSNRSTIHTKLIQLQKFFAPFSGWFLTPKFRYYLYVWSANTSQGDDAQVVGAGNLTWNFNRFVSVGAII